VTVCPVDIGDNGPTHIGDTLKADGFGRSGEERSMVWKERSRVDERIVLIGAYMKGEEPMSELARQFGVSRKTAYKWVARYNEEGPSGLVDRSRAPITHPSRVDAAVIEALIQARRSHPHWGGREILAWLAVKQPRLELPVASTVSALFAHEPARHDAERLRTRILLQRRTNPIASGVPTSRATSRQATRGDAIRSQ
jgi:transposase-like protein